MYLNSSQILHDIFNRVKRPDGIYVRTVCSSLLVISTKCDQTKQNRNRKPHITCAAREKQIDLTETIEKLYTPDLSRNANVKNNNNQKYMPNRVKMLKITLYIIVKLLSALDPCYLLCVICIGCYVTVVFCFFL